jgi:hypothetical protein
MKDRLGKLLTIKSLVTLGTTVIFGFLALRGQIAAQEVLTIYTVIIGFYLMSTEQGAIATCSHSFAV